MVGLLSHIREFSIYTHTHKRTFKRPCCTRSTLPFFSLRTQKGAKVLINLSPSFLGNILPHRRQFWREKNTAGTLTSGLLPKSGKKQEYTGNYFLGILTSFSPTWRLGPSLQGEEEEEEGGAEEDGFHLGCGGGIGAGSRVFLGLMLLLYLLQYTRRQSYVTKNVH